MKLTVNKFGLLIVYSALACFYSCETKSVNNSEEAKQLLDLEKEAIKKEFKNDTTYLSSIMDSTFIELSNGRIKNKHDVLKTIYKHNMENTAKGISPDSFLLEEPIVNVYGNAAVVTFIMHTFSKNQDTLIERYTRFYDVWVKRDHQWKAVTWQASPVED
jgi:hypothetical protein